MRLRNWINREKFWVTKSCSCHKRTAMENTDPLRSEHCGLLTWIVWLIPFSEPLSTSSELFSHFVKLFVENSRNLYESSSGFLPCSLPPFLPPSLPSFLPSFNDCEDSSLVNSMKQRWKGDGRSVRVFNYNPFYMKNKENHFISLGLFSLI